MAIFDKWLSMSSFPSEKGLFGGSPLSNGRAILIYGYRKDDPKKEKRIFFLNSVSPPDDADEEVEYTTNLGFIDDPVEIVPDMYMEVSPPQTLPNNPRV